MFVEPSVVRLFLKMDSKVLPEKKKTQRHYKDIIQKRNHRTYFILEQDKTSKQQENSQERTQERDVEPRDPLVRILKSPIKNIQKKKSHKTSKVWAQPITSENILLKLLSVQVRNIYYKGEAVISTSSVISGWVSIAYKLL